MIKTIIGTLLFLIVSTIEAPDVKVAGAMKNIMIKGDLSAHVDIDTLNKTHLFGLGPVAGLKGEIIILDGKVYTSSVENNKLLNQRDKISQAAMLVYSNVEKWKHSSFHAQISSFAALEAQVEATASTNGLDPEIPFAFRIEAYPGKTSYHVIDWKDKIVHTSENHKQFAYSSQLTNQKVVLLGFYSKHHQSIFTHHTTYMHIHVLDEKTKTVGHLDDIALNGPMEIYLAEK